MASALIKLTIVVVILTGCTERFRYFCQDPSNWSASVCQRPECAINGVCPDQLNRPADMKAEPEK